MARFQLLTDPFENAPQVVYDVTIPKAHDTITVPSDFVRASRICVCLEGVLSPIEFDCQLQSGTSKIDDMTADRMLPAKTGRACEFSQCSP